MIFLIMRNANEWNPDTNCCSVEPPWYNMPLSFFERGEWIASTRGVLILISSRLLEAWILVNAKVETTSRLPDVWIFCSRVPDIFLLTWCHALDTRPYMLRSYESCVLLSRICPRQLGPCGSLNIGTGWI